VEHLDSREAILLLFRFTSCGLLFLYDFSRVLSRAQQTDRVSDYTSPLPWDQRSEWNAQVCPRELGSFLAPDDLGLGRTSRKCTFLVPIVIGCETGLWAAKISQGIPQE